MGRTTFEPALNNERWPWPTLNVFVLASDRPAETPDHVVVDSDPARLLEKVPRRQSGPRLTSSVVRARSRSSLGSAGQARVGLVPPMLLGRGMQLTPVTQPRHGDDPRARARPPAGSGPAPRCGRSADAPGREAGDPRFRRPPRSTRADSTPAERRVKAARRSSARSWGGAGLLDRASAKVARCPRERTAQRTVGDREPVGHDGAPAARARRRGGVSHGGSDQKVGNRGHASSCQCWDIIHSNHDSSD